MLKSILCVLFLILLFGLIIPTFLGLFLTFVVWVLKVAILIGGTYVAFKLLESVWK
jgi:hypothetical protein